MNVKNLPVIRKDKSFMTDIIIFSISFFILMISLLAFYPGIMSSDSMSQWDQIQKNVYTSWHPIFHTLFEKVITLVWNSPAAVAVVQSIIFSLLITLIFKFSREKDKRFWVSIAQIFMTVCIFFIPVNFIYPITLWKDVMYSLSLCAILVYTYKGIINGFHYTLKDKFIIALISASIALFRYNGIITVFIIFGIMLLRAILNKRANEFGKFLILFIAFFIILKLPTLLVNQETGETRYKSGVFIHLTGCLLSNEKITEKEDLEFLDSIYDVEKWAKEYTPFTHDSLMFKEEFIKKDEYISQNSDKLKNIVIKYSLKNPKTIIKHYYYLTAITWKIMPFENNYYSFVDMTNSNHNDNYPSVNQQPILSKVNVYLTKYNDFVLSNKILNILIYRPALLNYLSILIVVALIFIKKKKTYALLMMPVLANTISMLPAMPAQDFRYFYINLLTLIGVGIIFATEIINLCYDNKKFRSVFLYLVFGVLTTILNISIFFIFTNIFKINYIIANIIAWIVAVAVAYITNKLYVFETNNNEKKSNIKEIFKFFLARVITLVMETLILIIMINLMNVSESFTKVFANILVLIANYILSKYLIFINGEKNEK